MIIKVQTPKMYCFQEVALKLTSLRKTVYQNTLNNVQKILNLDKPISISELCVQFSCPEAKEMALTILKSYQEKDTKIKDIEHPQYAAAAVYTSCKYFYSLCISLHL